MDKLIFLYRKYKEILNYIFFGALTTAVNFSAYFMCLEIFKIHYLTANIIAWFLSVIFAYVSNRLYVFKRVNFSIVAIIREVILFFGARFLSGAIETVSLFLMVEVFMLGEFVSKIIVAIIVVILNYVFSKLIVFRKYS